MCDIMANTHTQTHKRRQLQIPGPEYILLLAVSQMSVTSTRTPASHREFVSEKFASSLFPGDQLASCGTHILFVLSGKPQKTHAQKWRHFGTLLSTVFVVFAWL